MKKPITLKLMSHVFCLFLAGTSPCLMTSADAAEATSAGQAAPNSIENIDYSTLTGGKILVRLELKQPLQAPPAGFTIANPPRIALDLPDTTNGLGKSAVSVDQGLLRSLNIVQAGNRTRIVMNLSKAVQYNTRLEGKYLMVVLQGAETGVSTTNITPRFAEPDAAASKHAVRNVDFRRGKNGEGRIVVNLADTNTGIDIHQQGKSVVVDFINASLPKNLERRLDVTDFSTPVQMVDAYTHGNNVRMVVEPKGLWEHSAYQTDNQFILEVKAVAEDPNKLAQGTRPKYSGDKLSLNFQNVEVRSVLQVIADFTSLNIITSDTVSGNLTLRLKDVPWDQALDIIMQSKGLDMRKNGSVIWIAPRDELATREKLELEAKQQISELEPLQTESFHLKYQKAEAFKKVLSDDKQKILSKRGSAVIDERTNTLFVQDTANKLEDIRRLLSLVDVAVKQVLIDSRIVEASDTFIRNLGVRLGLHDTAGTGTTIGKIGSNQSLKLAVGGTLNDVGAHTGQIADTPVFDQSLNVNLGAASVAGFNPGSLAMVLFGAGASRMLNMEISALQADGKGKTISNPRVLTADQAEALIEQGKEIPYLQQSSSGATSVSFKKATLSLKVKPQITPDDNIIMDLKINKDAADFKNITAGVPPIDTKQITTQVLVENGGTVVIGGIYTQDENTTVAKVPFFGDLPVVGNLFKNKQTHDDRTELLIFVTPRILKDNLITR
jgi:type IV pilus assembly protein PilQ